MDDLELELKIGFLEEGQQLLQDAEQCFLEIESSPNDAEIINQLFRLAHNLKGSAKAVGFSELGAFTHLLESLLLKIKNLETPVTSAVVDLLLACKDQLQVMVEGLKADLAASFDTSELSARLMSAIDAQAGETSSELPASQQDFKSLLTPFSSSATHSSESLAADEYRNQETSNSETDFAYENSDRESSFENVPNSDAFHSENFEDQTLNSESASLGVSQSTGSMDLLGISELSALKKEELNSNVRSAETSQFKASPMTHDCGELEEQSPENFSERSADKPIEQNRQGTQKAAKQKTQVEVDESIRVSLSRVDQRINFVGEMVILQTVLFEQSYAGNIEAIRKTVHQLGKISKDLQDVSMSLRMVPLKPTFQKMQRIVRDTSRALGKSVEIELQGEETEVEKTVLEMIGDPLVHLVRNAVDHGIDSLEERSASGKPAQGRILLRAFHQADSIILEVSDDGKGIDADRLRAKAIKKNILKPGQTVTDRQALNLIFHPGFSTKHTVSDISGRGVGLDVVKINIEKLQGSVDVSTELDRGSKFSIQLPLTLAIIDATTVRVSGQRYAIPMSHIHESVQLKTGDIQSSVVG